MWLGNLRLRRDGVRWMKKIGAKEFPGRSTLRGKLGVEREGCDSKSL